MHSWRRYWSAEPWGPWRDNMHTALLAREIRRPQTARGSNISLETFMLRDPEERRDEARMGFVQAMRTLAIPKSEAKKRKRERAKKRKKVRVRK